MCGILGLVDEHQPVAEEHFRAMLTTLTHRGPDGEGVRRLEQGRVALGHRRLAIIDLSQAAAQPMTNEDESIWLTFNGEIYNYRALREELEKHGHRFRSGSDSEVIVHAYEQWGERCVSRLRGIFAFGIWDCNDRSLFLARDAFGVKPLYYARYGGRFCFASQPKAIAADPAFRRSLDPAAFSSFLAFGYVPRDQAIFRGMAKLPAGHVARVSHRGFDMRRYHEIASGIRYSDPDEAADAVAEKLVEAVDLQLVSDVPVGCFLSGGIDSSLITAIAGPRLSDLRAFTMGFDEKDSDEREFAAAVAQRSGTRHFTEVMTRTGLEQRLWELQEYFDEPFDPNGPLPFLELSRLAKRHDTVVCLGGDGGDEVFAGYLRYDDFDRPASLASGRGRAFWRWMRGHGLAGRRSPSRGDLERYFAYEGCLSRSAQECLLSPAFLEASGGGEASVMEPLFRSDLPPVAAAQRLDMDLYLTDHILCKVDRASMACGVETRVPLLDTELVATAFSVSLDVLYRRAERKSLLKDVSRRFLPEDFLTARKKGFSSPLAAWQDERLRGWGDALLEQSLLAELGVLQPGWRAGLQALPSAGRGWWLLLTAELWARRWLGGEAPPLPPHAGASRSAALA